MYIQHIIYDAVVAAATAMKKKEETVQLVVALTSSIITNRKWIKRSINRFAWSNFVYQIQIVNFSLFLSVVALILMNTPKPISSIYLHILKLTPFMCIMQMRKIIIIKEKEIFNFMKKKKKMK